MPSLPSCGPVLARPVTTRASRAAHSSGPTACRSGVTRALPMASSRQKCASAFGDSAGSSSPADWAARMRSASMSARSPMSRRISRGASSSRRAATSASTTSYSRASRRSGSHRPTTSSRSVIERPRSAANASASIRLPCASRAWMSSSAFEAKCEYSAPLLTPAAAAMSATRVPSYPRSAKISAAAPSSRSRVSAAVTPAMRPMQKLKDCSFDSSTARSLWPAGPLVSYARRSRRIPVRCFVERNIIAAARARGRESEAGVTSGLTGIEPIDFAAAYEVVTERIRRAIHIGSYLPGDKLPPERTLAQQLGVSRTTVREAIRVLEGEGYVVSRRGASGGILVLDQAENEERIRPLLTEKLPEIEETFDYRIAVEGAAARLAADRRTDEDLAILRDAYEVMRADRETLRFRAADNVFHLAIADAARNRLMRQAIEDARAAMWVGIDRLITQVFTNANRHHKHILDAIADRDPDAAQKAVVDHLEHARRDLRRSLR